MESAENTPSSVTCGDSFPLLGEAFVQKAEIGITLHIALRFATIRREKSFYGKEA